MEEQLELNQELKIIAARQYCIKDQISFAKISGDFNPIHVDSIEARRLLFGEVVVHGIHQIIWALATLLEQIDIPIKLTSLKARFIKPILLQRTIYLHITLRSKNSVECKIYANKNVDSTLLCSINVTFVKSNIVREQYNLDHEFSIQCQDAIKEALQNKTGNLEIGFNVSELNNCYPKLLDKLDAKQLGFILTTTRLVGMECPGLNSLYMGLKIDFGHTMSNQLSYQVLGFNDQINTMTIEAASEETHATIQCIVRPSKIVQQTVNELIGNALIKKCSSQFANQRALIIGGSRGLGELTAKILACCGAESIKITYQKGGVDAQKVVEDISTVCSSQCFQYDVTHNIESDTDEELFSNITHCYYFASPKILPNMEATVDMTLLQKYLNSYLLGLQDIANKLLKFNQSTIKLFNPSTVFIDSLEPGFKEYVFAKNISELYCKYLEQNYPGLQFINVRFPKMKTDQTASIMSSDFSDPADQLLDYLMQIKG